MSQLEEPIITEPIPAPEIVVDGYATSMVTNQGIAKLTFYSVCHNVEEDRTERRIVLRLTIPIGELAHVWGSIGEVLKNIEAQAKAIQATANADTTH